MKAMKILTLLLLVFTLSSNYVKAQSKEDIEYILDDWANDEFNNCYSGRTYKSISVSDYYMNNEKKTIEVEGYVSYLNLLDVSVRWKYKAYIKVYSGNRLKMTFNKYDGFSEDWEVCERTYSN